MERKSDSQNKLEMKFGNPKRKFREKRSRPWHQEISVFPGLLNTSMILRRKKVEDF